MNVNFSHIELPEKSIIYDMLYKMLPEQGCIEFQHDSPGKCHQWHQHPDNETLLIIEGELKFYYSDKTQICKKGDIIYLPAQIRHQSLALEKGCIYAIATQFIDFN